MMRALMVAACLLVAGCSGTSSDGDAFSPDDTRVVVRVVNMMQEPVQIRFIYGSSTPSTLGSVSGGGEEIFRFHYTRAGDLRLRGDFLNRISGTSNPIMDLQPGDRLELRIHPSRELRLSRIQ